MRPSVVIVICDSEYVIHSDRRIAGIGISVYGRASFLSPHVNSCDGCDMLRMCLPLNGTRHYGTVVLVVFGEEIFVVGSR